MKWAEGIDKSLLRRFQSFNEENKWIYYEFRKRSFEMVRSGKSRYGAWAIINSIRWEKDIATKGNETFKINNDFISLYARMLAYHHPQFLLFFNFRKMK